MVEAAYRVAPSTRIQDRCDGAGSKKTTSQNVASHDDLQQIFGRGCRGRGFCLRVLFFW